MRWDHLGLADRSRTSARIVQCRCCGLVYVDPRLREAETSVAYEREDYGFVRSHLADAAVDGRSHADRVLDEIATFRRAGSLVDVGCATGDFLIAARARGWRASGVEVSADAVGVARARGLEVALGTLADAPLADASVDVITMLDVIEHLPDPLAELRRIRRILRPGGLIVVETPNWRSVYRRLLGKRWAALQPHLHILYFDRTTVTRALRAAGFQPLRETTEIVALASPEASRRGLGAAWPRAIIRDAIVRALFMRPPGRLDHLFLRIGPAARARDGSFKAIREARVGGDVGSSPRRPLSKLVRWLNWPADRLFLRLGMGEQLRIVARAEASAESGR